MTSPSVTQDSNPYQNEPIWSRSEKTIARTAFDAALGTELHEVIQQAKKMASKIQQSSDLWDLEHYLTQRRKEIDRKYDYRYSQLTQVQASRFELDRNGPYLAAKCRQAKEIIRRTPSFATLRSPRLRTTGGLFK